MAGENDKKEEENTNPFEGFQTLDSDGEIVNGDTSDDNDDDAEGADDETEEEDQDDEDDTDDADDDEEGEAEEDDDDDDGSVDDDDDDADDDDDGGEDEDAEDEDENAEGKKPKKSSVKSRINQLTKRAYQAEGRAKQAEENNAALQERLDALEKKLTPDGDDAKDDDSDTSDDGVTKPDFNDKKYKYGELDPQYIEDIAEWRVEQKFRMRDKEQAEKDAKAKSEQQAKQWQDKFTTRVAEGEALYKDFKKVVVDGAEGDNPKYALTQDTVLMALESDVGAEVMYYIAKRPNMAAKIAQMSLVGQAKEFGRLEARFDKTKTPKKKKAPGASPPAKRAKGGTAAKKVDAKTDDFAAFEKQVHRQQVREAKRNQR